MLEARGVSKFFPGVKALQGVSLDARQGLDPRAAGRERRRQVDADQDHHRPLSSGRGRAPARRQARRASPTRAMPWRSASASCTRSATSSRASRWARTSCWSSSAASLLRPIDYAGMNREARRWLDMLELDVDPATPVSRLCCRQDAARRDRQGAVAALARAAARRADRVPDAARDGGAVPPSAASCATTASACSSSAHKLEEVQEICDRVTVLRDGRNACESRPMAGLGRQDLVRLMIGRSEQIPHWTRARSFRARRRSSR